jgi:hypothetical protein
MAVFVSYCPLFGVLGDLHGPWHLVHVWEAWPKTRRFCVLGPFSWAIAHCFGFPRWFTRPMTLSTCLIGMTKNSSFLRLWPFLWAIAHCFGVMGGLTWPMTLSTCLRGMTKNLSFLHFRAIFVSYSPQFWVFGVIFKPMTLSTCLICMTKNSSFLRLWPFLWAIAHCLGVLGIYMAHDT